MRRNYWVVVASALVIGVRFHTTRVAGSTTPSVEVLAYGTALNPHPAA